MYTNYIGLVYIITVKNECQEQKYHTGVDKEPIIL